MALTKITLTGAVDKLKAGFTKFNDLIDDLLSASNGLGASQIGVEDSSGNMAAVNVETALAEIYTDTANARTLADGLDENSATTTGSTWGFNAGTIRVDNSVISVAAATIGLTDDATNYVEVNPIGTMTKNTNSFTSGYIPVRQVTMASTVQTVSTDKRTWFNASPIANNDWKAQFTHVDDTDITIEPASYRHNGTVDQVVYWKTQLTYTFVSLGTNDWSYLYLDDSAIVTAATNVIAVGQLIDSTTEPAWSAAKGGWYNGEDRCIFAVFTDGTDDILAFYHDNNFVLFEDAVTGAYSSDPGTTWTDATLTMPKFSIGAQATFTSLYVDAGSVCHGSWRTKGGATGHDVTSVYDGGIWSRNTVRVVTNGSQLIEVKHDVADKNDIMTVVTNGWYLPIGI